MNVSKKTGPSGHAIRRAPHTCNRGLGFVSIQLSKNTGCPLQRRDRPTGPDSTKGLCSLTRWETSSPYGRKSPILTLLRRRCTFPPLTGTSPRSSLTDDGLGRGHAATSGPALQQRFDSRVRSSDPPAVCLNRRVETLDPLVMHRASPVRTSDRRVKPPNSPVRHCDSPVSSPDPRVSTPDRRVTPRDRPVR